MSKSPVNENFKVFEGESGEVLANIHDNVFHACITDPPYGQKKAGWDKAVPSAAFWAEACRTLRPGGFCIAFGNAKNYHDLATSMQNGGFIIKDQLMWLYSLRIPTANRLKSLHEPIVVAQKPYKGSLKANDALWGCGLININDNRVPWREDDDLRSNPRSCRPQSRPGNAPGKPRVYYTTTPNLDGRYPANVFGEVEPDIQRYYHHIPQSHYYAPRVPAKTRKDEGINHPTPKPVALMSHLVKIYAPKSGLILDPFCGSGSTGVAAVKEGNNFIGIDLSSDYAANARQRIKGARRP